jgi:large subunit ribosomal protein L25
MERVKIEAQLRDSTGKEVTKKVRQADKVPAIIYVKGGNLPVMIGHDSMKVLKSIHFSASTIIDMELSAKDKKETLSVLIKETQYSPLTEKVIHFDFQKVNLNEKIRVKVPVLLKGECKGIKEGGVLEQTLHHVEIEGFPLDLVEKIEVDITDLGVGQSLHVADLKIDTKLRMVTSKEETIAVIVTIEEEVVAEVGAAVEGAAPVEPEVLKEKKDKEGEEAEGAEAKGKDDKKPAAKEEKKPAAGKDDKKK